MSLIVTVFLLVFVTELIQWIGQSALLDIAYALYLRILNPTTASRQRALKSQLLSTKAELLQTSAQDQFAKWAKLRRSVDKGLVELEKLNHELSENKTVFAIKFNTFIWVMTTGLQFGIGWWYRRSAVFYLPPGWFGPLTWWLSLPFAPKGSVSVGVWQIACKRVIKIFERSVKDLASPPPPISEEEETKEKKKA